MRGAWFALALLGAATTASAQDPGAKVPTDHKQGGSKNIHVLAHVVTHPGAWKLADVEIEQEMNRPYVYTCGFVNNDVQIYDIKDPTHPRKIVDWSIENPELHRGIGAMDGKAFKIGDRYYYAQSYQFMQGSPDADLGAVILDVTGLPDPSTVRVVARIRYPQAPGGFHNTFVYKHSDGRVLYFVTVNQAKAIIYDLAKVVAGDTTGAIVGSVPNPTPFRAFGAGSYHDFYVGYDVARKRDVFYGAGLGGYSAWDVTHPEAPIQLFTITGMGLDIAHTFTPSPDGNYAVTETEYQYTPLKVWDLREGQDGTRKNLDLPISAWTADWHDLSHNHEVRWPYVFVSAYEDGLFVFDLKDPKNPKTDGWYYTCTTCVHEMGFGGNPDNGWQGTNSVEQGAFGVDVRNADGLIVLSDMRTGLWLFQMNGFKGWSGKSIGEPDISSAQDFDHGPMGAATPK